MIEPLAAAAFVALWLATWLAHSTLLYGGAWLIERLGLPRAAAAREHLWRAAMLGALLTATLQSVGLVERVPLTTLLGRSASSPAVASTVAPAVAPTVTPQEPATAAAVTTAAATTATPSIARAPTTARPARSTLPAVTSPELTLFGTLRDAISRSWVEVLGTVWLVGAAFAVLRLLVLGWLARRELSDRAPAGGPLASELDALCAAQRVRRPALSVAPALAGPISLPNGEIVVPPWAVEALDARQRRALLAHELAHQVRHDPQWLAFALGLHALLWLQPLHGLARRRLAALAELQADAWAARAVGDPRALAECLAECAERLSLRRAGLIGDNRAALFGAAMTKDSLLVERVDRLLEDMAMAMRVTTTSWMLRGGVLATLVAGCFVFPGCDMQAIQLGGSGSSMTLSVSDGDTSVKLWRPGYSLHMETDGAITFAADESDVATLERGCSFVLEESLDGVDYEYTVKADASGVLTRSLKRDGASVPLDEAGRQWLAAALPRMFRESGYDAQARVARLLEQGGPERALAEVDLCATDYARSAYLGELLGTSQLDPQQLSQALASAARIDSDYDLHQALSRALELQSLDGERFALLLRTAGQMDSDYEQSTLLVEAARLLPDDEGARAAWLATAGELDSDYERGQALEAGLKHALRRGGEAGAGSPDAAGAGSAGGTGGAAGVAGSSFAAQLVSLAAERMSSDYELRGVLESVASHASDPALAASYLAAARQIESDFERRSAMVALLDEVELDNANLATALDVTAGVGSDFEKRTILEALAPSVAPDATLNRRYREVASHMNGFERGAALTALDEASRY